jgi:hypothetical protein
MDMGPTMTLLSHSHYHSKTFKDSIRIPSYVNMTIASDANKGPDVPSVTVGDSNGDIALDIITEEIS